MLVLVLALILFCKIFVLNFFDFGLVLVFVLVFVLGFALGFALTFFNFVLRDYLSEIMELGADFYIFGFVMKRRTILHVVRVREAAEGRFSPRVIPEVYFELLSRYRR